MNRTAPSDAELDAAMAQAYAAEAVGDLAAARAQVAWVASAVVGRRSHLYLLEWRARLEMVLGEYASADETLRTAREAAVTAGRHATAFRMDVMRAQVARKASDPDRARRLLAELRGPRAPSHGLRLGITEHGLARMDLEGDPLGIPKRESLREIAAWLRALRYDDPHGPSSAILRVETALVIAELWAEQGLYRSALGLVAEIEGSLEGASDVVSIENVRLLQAEWLLAAGQFDAAAARLAVRAFDSPVDRLRATLVRTRLALARGRLAEAFAQLPALASAPRGDRELYTAAMVMRIAVMTELNLLSTAERLADDAITALGDAPGDAPLVARLERARRGAVARARSAVALWELPYAPRSTEVEPAALGDESVGGQAAWAIVANGVIAELDRGAFDAATRCGARLAQIAAGVESQYVAIRARFFEVLVGYYTRGPTGATLEELRAIAIELHDMGARLAEAQALRFAAWAAARCDRVDDYVELARRAAAVIDAIARELDEPARSLFLLNKWNGRDELVASRMRELLEGARARSRPPGRRELCHAFREIDQLTHWPIDDAFGEAGTELPRDATSDRVALWVRDRLADTATRRQAPVLSPIRLWWFPSRTLVLHYHVLADRAYVFRIARRHLDVAVLPVGRIQLPKDGRGIVDNPEALRALAEDLGVAGALNRFPDIRRLVIVPHDAIANVPFAALRVGDGVLCDRVTITQLDRLGRLRRGSLRRRRGRVVSVGLASYAGSGLRDLPAAEAEACAVVAALGVADPPRIGVAASRAATLADLPGAAFWHVAAHGAFDRADPAASGVLLRGEADYETLTLRDLRGLDLRAMRLATLASCCSAESAQLPGRERICVPTALLDAGVRGAVASLWSVHDDPSRELMTELYTRVRSSSAAGALRAVQSQWYHRGRAPETWAGFVYYGNG